MEDTRDLEAVIKSAARAASRKTKSRGPSRPCCPHAEPSPAGSPGFLDLGLPGGCASSRLDHSFQIQTKNPCRVSKSQKRIPKPSKGVSQLSKPFKNESKRNHPSNMHPKMRFYAGNSISRRGEGFGTGPGAPEHYKICKNVLGFSPSGPLP